MRHALLWITADIWKVIMPGLPCWQYLRVPINLLFDSKHHPCIAGLVKHHQGSRLVRSPARTVYFLCLWAQGCNWWIHLTGPNGQLMQLMQLMQRTWRSLIKPRVLVNNTFEHSLEHQVGNSSSQGILCIPISNEYNNYILQEDLFFPNN